MFKILVQFEIFPMLERPSEMENVPPKITLRYKLTLNSQILAQTLRYGHVDHGLLSLWFLLYADINSYSSLVSAYGSNFRMRTVLLTDTFSNSRGCPLTRELSPIN